MTSVFVAVIVNDSDGDVDITVFNSETGALRRVADYCRGDWNRTVLIWDEDGRVKGPQPIPDTDQEVVDQFFEAVSEGEADRAYRIEECAVQED